MLLANLEQSEKDIGSLERMYVKISPLTCINDMVTLLIFFVDFLFSFIVVFCCRWFSPGTPASSTTKTGRHDIAEILLKVALKHQISNQLHYAVSPN
jgi:hypothetical protein